MAEEEDDLAGAIAYGKARLFAWRNNDPARIPKELRCICELIHAIESRAAFAAPPVVEVKAIARAAEYCRRLGEDGWGSGDLADAAHCAGELDKISGPSHQTGITLAIQWLRDVDKSEKPATQGHSAVWLAGEMERELLACEGAAK